MSDGPARVFRAGTSDPYSLAEETVRRRLHRSVLRFPPRLAGFVLAAAFCSACSAARGVKDEGRVEVDDPGLLALGLVYDDTIVTESGRTVDFNGQAVVPRYLRIAKSGGGADLDVDVAITNVIFGINKDFTIKLGLPYITKSLDRPGSLPVLRSGGLGDAPLVGKYRFYQETGLAETTEASFLFGVELPTGRDDERDAGALLPAPLQPGSGSLDAILGGAVTRVDGRWLGNADVIAKINSEANDYSFGNSLRVDVGGHFRALPARYERYDQLTVNLVAELNSVWLDRDTLEGDRVSDSGGFKLFATPGFQVIFNRYVLFEAALQLPLVMDLNGSQLEEDFVAIFGLRARF